MMALATCITSNHTAAGIAYGANVNEKSAKMVYSNLIMSDKPKGIAKEFNLLDTGSRCKKPTISVVLSLSPKDREAIRQKGWNEPIRDWLKQMKLDNHQCVAYSHHNTEHPHVHLYISRKGFDGKIFPQHKIGSKAGIAADKVAEKYGFSRPKEIKKARREVEILTWEKHNGKTLNEVKSIIYHKHESTIRNKSINSYEQYVSYLQKEGINVRPILSKTGILRGFNYDYDGLKLKASDVHPRMSLYHLTKKIHPQTNFKDFKKIRFDKLRTDTSVEKMKLINTLDEAAQSCISNVYKGRKKRPETSDVQETNPYSPYRQDFQKSEPTADDQTRGHDTTDFEKQETQESLEESRQAIYLQHLYIINQLRVSSEEEYIKAFAKANIKVSKVLSTNGFVNGFRYERMGNSLKGSDVHRSMSLSNIRKCFAVVGKMANEKGQDSSLPNSKTHSSVKGIAFEVAENITSQFIPSSTTMTDELDGGFDETLMNKKKRKKGLRR